MEIWAGLDQASIEAVTDHFRYRRICDRPEKMAVFFGRDMNAYRQRYDDIIRLERVNGNIDPMTSRYFEAVFTADDTAHTGTTGTDNSTRKDTGNVTRNGLTSTDMTRTEDGKTARATTNTASNGENVVDTTSFGSIVTDTYGAQDHTKSGTYKDTETFNNYMSTKAFQDRQREITRSGTETDTESGGWTDTDGGTDTIRHAVDTTETTTKTGKFTSKDEQLDSSKAREAAKAAPMSAVGITREGGGGGQNAAAYNTVKAGSIAPLDFEYASRYGEKSGESGSSRTHTEFYGTDGETTKIQTDGRKQNNTDSTEHGKTTQRTFQNYQSQKTFNDLKDIKKDTGTEIDTKSGSREMERSYNDFKETDGTHTDTHGKSGIDARTVNTNTNKDEHGTDTGVTHNEIKKTGTVTESDATHHINNTEGSRQTSGSTDETRRRETVNQYLGREGLTPQDALKSAIGYLMTTSTALHWLIGKLEHNFIQVFDLWEEDDEYGAG